MDYAKKNIDPAHPKSGPYGVDAGTDPTVSKSAGSPAVTFGGALSGLNAKSSGPQTGPDAGTQLDLSA